MAITKAPFGAYVQPTGVCDATGQAEILVILDQFMALMPVIVGGVDSSESSAAIPGFNDIDRHFIEKLQAEIDDIKTKVDAMPTA